MKELNINTFLRKNPILLEKNRNRTDVRAILEGLSPEEIGELVEDCDYLFLQTIKNFLAAHIEFLCKRIRRNREEGIL